MSEFESLNTIYERTHEGSAPQVGKRGAHNVTHGFRVYRALDASCVIARPRPPSDLVTSSDYIMMM